MIVCLCRGKEEKTLSRFDVWVDDVVLGNPPVESNSLSVVTVIKLNLTFIVSTFGEQHLSRDKILRWVKFHRLVVYHVLTKE